MKNLTFYIALFTSLFVFSCEEPLDDLYKDLDIDQEGGEINVVKDFEYTLTEDDYNSVDKTFGNFNSEDEAKELVPAILSDLYPYLAKGSTSLITYAIFNGSSPRLSEGSEMTVSDGEYEALGYTYGNFDDLEGDLPIYAEYKMPDADNGTYLDVTHDYYNGSFTEKDVVTRVVKTAAYGWVTVYELDSDVYKDFFGESFSNFSNTDEAEEKIPVYLSSELKFAEAGDTKLVQYVYYDGEVKEGVAHYTFDGEKWVLYGDAYQVTNQTLSFGFNGSEWVPDNTIKYRFGYSDYQWVGEATAESNPAGSASALQYGNFDVSLWTPAQVYAAVTSRLEVVFPDTEEGQKYLVTYATWNPGAGEVNLHVIYQNGEFVPFVE